MQSGFRTPIMICAAFIVLSVFLFSSCGRKWKETTNAQFCFTINKEMGTNRVLFDRGTIRLTEIHLVGKRRKGDDVEFVNSPVSSIDFASGTATPAIVYDLPQGTYESLDLQFRLDPLDSATPAIGLLGSFFSPPNDTFPVYFNFDASQIYSVRAVDASGNTSITVVEDQPVKVNVHLDPKYWFSVVTLGQLQSATHANVHGQNAIVINSLENLVIYQSVSSRVGESTQVIVQ